MVISSPPIFLVLSHLPRKKNLVTLTRIFVVQIKLPYSLTSGSVPDYFKTASVQPLLKKPSLSPAQLQNYRPISKVPFLKSKILGKVITDQLLKFVEGHKIFDKFQSIFHHKNSTETSLLRVTNDILMHADKGEYSIYLI